MANLLKTVLGNLKEAPVFSSFPLGLLLIGLEKLVELDFFSCPCKVELNALLTASIFIGPALFTFTLMFILLRPFTHGCCKCGGAKNDTQNCPKAFVSCLIPPVIWIFILLLDGEYVACGMTYWKGDYVLDSELNRFWCKPTEVMQNKTDLRDLTRKYIYQSQYAGYILISLFSAISIFFVGIYDCCISGKCAYCPSQLLCCIRQTADTQSERQTSTEDNSLSLHETSSSTSQNQINRPIVPPRPPVYVS